MSQLKELFETANIPEEKLKTMAELFISNPMALMGEIQEMNLPPDFLQKAMAVVMSNPQEVVEFAKSLGLDDELINEARTRIEAMMPSKS
jgi:hypothetical protein